MTVRKLYLESDLPTGAQTAGITQIGEDEAGPFVCLTATWFHPQGGGQRADEGTIAGRRVVTVQHAADGGIQHVLDSTDGLSVGATVDIVVDANTRLRHARLHSGGHLIAAVVEAAGVGAEATDGHHWPGEARVQFAETAGAVQLNAATIQAAVDDAIAADLPFRIEGDPQTDRKDPARRSSRRPLRRHARALNRPTRRPANSQDQAQRRQVPRQLRLRRRLTPKHLSGRAAFRRQSESEHSPTPHNGGLHRRGDPAWQAHRGITDRRVWLTTPRPISGSSPGGSANLDAPGNQDDRSTDPDHPE
jgi:alanyl-tRNA synthetase